MVCFWGNYGDESISLTAITMDMEVYGKAGREEVEKRTEVFGRN